MYEKMARELVLVRFLLKSLLNFKCLIDNATKLFGTTAHVRAAQTTTPPCADVFGRARQANSCITPVSSATRIPCSPRRPSDSGRKPPWASATPDDRSAVVTGPQGAVVARRLAERRCRVSAVRGTRGAATTSTFQANAVPARLIDHVIARSLHPYRHRSTVPRRHTRIMSVFTANVFAFSNILRR